MFNYNAGYCYCYCTVIFDVRFGQFSHLQRKNPFSENKGPPYIWNYFPNIWGPPCIWCLDFHFRNGYMMQILANIMQISTENT